jgi:undecaprenyl-diphosphatase
MNINIQLFNLINGLACKIPLVDSIMIIFSKYVPDVFMLALALVYMLGVLRKDEKLRYTAIDVFMVTVICLFASYIIGALVYVPRPFVSRKVNLLFPHVIDASFPSDHAVGTMSIAVGANKVKRSYGIIFIILSLIVGFSRVYVGHHYPLDVIGGYAVVLCVDYIYGKIIRDIICNFYIKCEKTVMKHRVALK